MEDQDRQIPRKALAVTGASALLAVLLGVATVGNLRREQQLMESFLLREGLTLIRALEAGARNTLASGPAGPQSLNSLLKEAGRTKDIAYIRVVGWDGQVVAEAHPGASDVPAAARPASRVISSGWMATRLVQTPGEKTVFEVSKEFRTRAGGLPGAAVLPSLADRYAIYLGLSTKEFDAARAEDVRRSLLVAGALLLCGSGGLYFLFISQRGKVPRGTTDGKPHPDREVIESLPDGLVALDAQGRILLMNRRAKEILGATEGPALGRHLEEVTAGDCCDLPQRISKDGTCRDVPTHCAAPHGKSIPLKVTGSSLRNRDGKSIGTVLLVRDLRETPESSGAAS